MKIGLAGETPRPKARALVLGSRPIAVKIAEELTELGYQCTFERELLTQILPPSDPNGLGSLRNALKEFSGSPEKEDLSPLDCIHPGTQAWAERPELGQVAQEMGMVALCPPARAVSIFSSKLALFFEAEKLGIPNLALGLDPMNNVREIENFVISGRIHFPVVLKSVRPGCGPGIHVLHSPEDLESKLLLWIEQLRRNTGEVVVIAERYVDGARRIVVPFVRFRDGTFQRFAFVDASLQSKYRKTLEFSPAESLDNATENLLEEWTKKIAVATGYVGVGALEYFVDGPRVHLLEGVPRLSTTFSLWEEASGIKAVEWQLAAVLGGSAPLKKAFLALKSIHTLNTSISLALRLCAEDPVLQLPAPGKIRELKVTKDWKFPQAEANWIFPYCEGDSVDSDGDGLLGILQVKARTSRQAMILARGILDDLWIAGSLQANDRFLKELLSHPWVLDGIAHAGFIEEEFIPEVRPPDEILSVLGKLGELASAFARPESLTEPGIRWVVGDQWAKPDASSLSWTEGPQFWRDDQERPGLTGTLSLADGRPVRTCLFPMHDERWLGRIGSWTLTVRRSTSQARARAKEGQRPLLSLVTGRVHSILYRPQTRISAHQPLIVIESMRILVPHALPVDSKIASWNVQAEEKVVAGQELAKFDTLKS